MLSQNSQFFTSNIQILSSELGNAIETKYQEHCMKKNGDFEKIKTTYDKYTDYTISKLDPSAPESSITNNHREEWIKVMRELNSLRSLEDHTWPYSIKQNVGKFLFEKVLIKACKIDRNLIKHKTNHASVNSSFLKKDHKYKKLLGSIIFAISTFTKIRASIFVNIFWLIFNLKMAKLGEKKIQKLGHHFFIYFKLILSFSKIRASNLLKIFCLIFPFCQICQN